MRQRIRTIIRKEFRQVFRDPRMRGLLLFPPLMQLLIFGYAANLDVNSSRIAWMDEDHSSNSASIVSAYAGQTIARYAAEVTEGRQRQKLVAAGVPMHPAVPQVVTET